MSCPSVRALEPPVACSLPGRKTTSGASDQLAELLGASRRLDRSELALACHSPRAALGPLSRTVAFDPKRPVRKGRNRLGRSVIPFINLSPPFSLHAFKVVDAQNRSPLYCARPIAAERHVAQIEKMASCLYLHRIRYYGRYAMATC